MLAVSRSNVATVVLLMLAASVHADMEMDQPADWAQAQWESLHVHWRMRTLHFIIAMIFVGVIPSLSTVYAVAEQTSVAIMMQVVTLAWTFVEYFIGFTDPTGHESAASSGTNVSLFAFTVLTIGVGVVLTKRGGSIVGYKWLSGLCVVLGMVKLGMNVVSMLSFCYDSHTGQCNAHGIMGMSFVAYGFVLSMVLVIPWLRNNKGNYSQEFYDSVVITVWGIINTFTEHRPWEEWSHGDYQHTSMGIIFWCAGMLGVWLSLGRKRNFVPALTMICTGYAMSEHVQETIISTKVHGFFGTVLIFGGLARIVEISIILDDEDSKSDMEIRSFQYLTPFALVLGGLLFMCANEEQLTLVVNLGADHSSYILCIISAACVIQMWMLMMLKLYLILVAKKGYSEIDTLDTELDDL